MRWRVKHQLASIGHGLAVATLVLLPVAYTGTAYAAGAFVQQSPVTIVNSNATSATATLPTAATAGNLLVVVCAVNGASNITVTGYSNAAAPVNGTVSQGIFYKIAAGGETGITCTSSLRTKNGIAAHAYEYSGMNTLSTLDTSGTSSGTGTALSSGSATPTSTSSLVFTAFVAAGGTTFTGLTAGYTKRADTASGMHVGQADVFTTASTAQSASVTNSASAAWRGQIAIFKVAVGSKWADIVDGSNNPVASPSIAFPARSISLGCDTSATMLGTSTQKLRVSNTTPSPTWSIQIAATAGNTTYWDGGNASTRYDFNDPTVDGCLDGADADSLAGKLFVNPSTATITPVGVGCTSTGISLGANIGFSEGTQDSITIITAGSSAMTNCIWDITNVQLLQRIPDSQKAGTYNLSLTLTLLAS